MNFLFRIITLVFLVYPIFEIGFRNDPMVELTFFMNAILGVYCLFYNNKHSISLLTIFSVFYSIFLVYAPIQQYKNNIRLFGVSYLNDMYYIKANLLLFAIFLIIFLIYKIKNKKTNVISKETLFENKTKFISKSTIAKSAVISILSFIIVFISLGLNVNNLLFRGLSENNDSLEMGTTWMIITYFVRPIPMIILLLLLENYKLKKSVFLFFLFIAILTVFPTSMARFSIASLYLPLILYTIRFIHKKNVFQLIIILGLFVIFPFLDNFRHFDKDKQITFSPNIDMFTTGHFDSYQSFLIVVNGDIVTYGNQLLGVLFFWIPRIFWEEKPVGSGVFVAENFGYSYHNVSCNFFAEGYLNFGIIGCFIFAIFLAIILSKLDYCYQNNIKIIKNFNVYYFLFLGFLFFIMRGDLLSSFAYFCGFMLAVRLCSKILSKD